MEARLNGTVKTIFTGLAALLLVFILVKVVLWTLYDTNVFDYLNNDAENLKFSYNESSKTYTGVLDDKYDITIKNPTRFNFDGYLKATEKQVVATGANKALLTLTITPDFKSDFTYTISVNEITSTGAVDKGSFDIDPSTLKLIEDNTTDQAANNYLTTYNTRIQNLIKTVNTSFGQDIG